MTQVRVQWQMADTNKHHKESCSSIQGREFLGQLLKKDPATWSYEETRTIASSENICIICNVC
jgi:hypothetical protein